MLRGKYEDWREQPIQKVQVALIWIALSYLAAVPGIFAGADSTWYRGLVKPPLQPPGWVFSVVWLTLYTLIGVAAYLIYKQPPGTENRLKILSLFIIQLILNALWSPLFFGLHSILLGLVDQLLLIVFIATLVQLSWELSRAAGLIFELYLLWIFFAFYLNFTFLLLN